MEIERGGSGPAVTFDLARGRKRPASPSSPLGEEVDSPTSDEIDEWLISDSDHEDEENQGIHRPFTVEDFPRVSCDQEKQTELLYGNQRLSFENLAQSGSSLHSRLRITHSILITILLTNLKFVSAKIAGYRHNHSGPVKISGFIAARDTFEPLRNYVYRREIDNCEAVTVKSKTGVARLSLSSPARVISFSSRVFIEFELHARSDDEVDGPIIEGCTELYNMYASKSFIEHNRLYGEKCALDIKYIVLINALEAWVDVKALRLGATPSGINLKICAKTSNFDEVICLFKSAAPYPGDTMSFAFAAERRKGFDLYIQGSARDDPLLGIKRQPQKWRCFFAAGYHAMVERVAELGQFATVSVKVTWRTHWKRSSSG